MVLSDHCEGVICLPKGSRPAGWETLHQVISPSQRRTIQDTNWRWLSYHTDTKKINYLQEERTANIGLCQQGTWPWRTTVEGYLNPDWDTKIMFQRGGHIWKLLVWGVRRFGDMLDKDMDGKRVFINMLIFWFIKFNIPIAGYPEKKKMMNSEALI